MIALTKKNREHSGFLINHKLIERVEGEKDTILVLVNGKRVLVEETKEEVAEKIKGFEADVMQRANSIFVQSKREGQD